MIKKICSKKIYIFILIICVMIICIGIYIVTNVIKNIQESYTSAFYFPDYPKSNVEDKTAAEVAVIQRGAYLVKAGDCIACHTDTGVKGPTFAGGLPMGTPFGVIYTPNITPDKETGIGNWTDDQFIKAMHDGVSPQGEFYYPAFPYLYFNNLTNDDLRAIRAYLNTIPAVHQKNRENSMVWPFNWRFVQLGWRILFFYPNANGPYQPNPKESAAWNRGAYLVEGLGHCAMCHTPSYYILSEKISLGAPIRKYHLTGATVQGYLAPNITKTNLGAIPDNEMIDVFTKARLIGGGDIQGPMLEAVHDSLSHLTIPDILAMSTYLKTVEATMPPEPKMGTGSSGAYIYNSYCSGCHEIGVGGAPRFGDTASWGPLVRSGIKKLYAVAISGGGNMPAKGTCFNCSNLQIQEAVDYMVSAAMNPAHEQVVPTANVPKDGQKIYQENCSACHTSGANQAPKLGDKQAWKSVESAGFFAAYKNITTGKNGHPLHGGCKNCTDAELISALKYMMQQGSSKNSYILW